MVFVQALEEENKTYKAYEFEDLHSALQFRPIR